MTTTPIQEPPDAASSTLSRRSALARLAVGSLASMTVLGAGTGSAGAHWTPERSRQAPNRFDLAGDGTEITYDTTSLTGMPHLSYRGEAGELEFSGDEIDTEDSLELGHLVTVMIDVVYDGYTLDLTVLLPEIHLIDDHEPTAFSTLAIVTRHLTTIAGPDPLDGALTEYSAIELDGTASLVIS